MDLSGLLREEEYNKPTNCSKCGKFLKYVGVGEYKCPECGFTEYDDYGKVRAYLEANPGSTVVQVEAATGVPQKIIYKLVSDDKIAVKNSGYLKGGE